MILINNAVISIPKPVNENIFPYAPASAAKANLKRAIGELSDAAIDFPLIIGGWVSPRAARKSL
jgi:1-pyrroline-5-carboxylate dehydrogenase